MENSGPDDVNQFSPFDANKTEATSFEWG